MLKNLVLALLAVVASLAGSSVSFGQFYEDGSVFPGLGGIPGGVQQELAFSSMMDAQARQFCHNWYLERQAYRIRHNYWGPMEAPVTAADLNRSNRELQATYDRHNAQWHLEQQRLYGGAGQVGTVGQFSEQGIRGYAPHIDPRTGHQVRLPYGPNVYQRDLHDRYRPRPADFDDGQEGTYVPQFNQ